MTEQVLNDLARRAFTGWVREGLAEYKQITVNGAAAELYLDEDAGEANILMWIDPRDGAILQISAALCEEDLVKIASSVGLVKTYSEVP